MRQRMDGNEYEEAIEFLRDYMKIPKLAAAVALEIGGSNGMINVSSPTKPPSYKANAV